LLDLLIGILEWETKLFGKQTPDGAFASTHRAYENEIVQRLLPYGDRSVVKDSRR
jgi:hypothetical protein